MNISLIEVPLYRDSIVLENFQIFFKAQTKNN